MKNLGSAIRIATVFATAVLCSFAAARPSFASPPVVKSATVQNLQSAYNMENDAHARYVAFAQKADREGYGEVASLFRAAARSEEVLMRDHAEVLRTLGGEQHVHLVAWEGLVEEAPCACHIGLRVGESLLRVFTQHDDLPRVAYGP